MELDDIAEAGRDEQPFAVGSPVDEGGAPDVLEAMESVGDPLGNLGDVLEDDGTVENDAPLGRRDRVPLASCDGGQREERGESENEGPDHLALRRLATRDGEATFAVDDGAKPKIPRRVDSPTSEVSMRTRISPRTGTR
jgi:hypothetical protein